MLEIQERAVSLPSPMTAKNLAGLRVLHLGKFYPPHPGGMESHLQALCGELKHSIDIEVVVANGEREALDETIDGIPVSRLGTLLNLGATPVCPRLVGRVRGSNADIVHIHWPNPAAVLAYLASGHRGRLVVTYHSDIIRQRLLRKPFWPFLRRTLKRADAIIATSPNYLETSSILKQFRGRCRVIPFGIPLSLFDQVNEIDVSQIRKKYGPRIVLGVGRLVYYKGFKYLIRAMRDIDGHLLVVGKGALRADLGQEALAAGVNQRVSFLTDVDDVRPYFHAAEVFCLPSIARSEAFGIVQLEAMACGKPVVNTALDSGVPFVSPHGVSGLTVAPADPSGLSRAINTLLDDERLRDRYGRAGRKRVEEDFSLKVMAERTLKLYEEVMNPSGR